MVKLAYSWISKLGKGKLQYQLQYHADHDVEELKRYWAALLDIRPENIKPIRKSNSGQLGTRNFRSQYGLLSVRVGDTIFRSKLQAWMDYVESRW